eukprot:TRINITY_DN24281_c0_g1_i3.p1 TRINITY_DN24281_c0_g1~~TRINITY_DN24281_c0_g1_i3.p1  ORF type:complete len:517 (+),score=216.70 TRINITY_DN24281_c0_g1_i3:79-1551(+)
MPANADSAARLQRYRSAVGGGALLPRADQHLLPHSRAGEDDLPLVRVETVHEGVTVAPPSPRVNPAATAAAAAEIAALRQRVAELEGALAAERQRDGAERERAGAEREQRDEARRQLQEELLAKADATIKAYRQKAEEEIARHRRAAQRAADRLSALRHAVASDAVDALGLGEDAAPAEPAAAQRRQQLLAQLGDAVLDHLIVLQQQQAGAGPPDDPEVVGQNVHRAVAQCFTQVVNHYEQVVAGMARDYEQAIEALRAEAQRAGGGEGARAEAVRQTLQANLEEERQRTALVCVRMKGSLQRRNAEFEGAVMRKAEDLVAQYKAAAEQASGRAAELQQELRAAQELLLQQQQQQQQPPPEGPVHHASLAIADLSAIHPERSAAAAGPPLPPPPSAAGLLLRDGAGEEEARHASFVREVTREMRREALGSSDPGSADVRLHFERNVLVKAQQLLRKYRPVVQRDRERARREAPPAQHGGGGFDGILRVPR